MNRFTGVEISTTETGVRFCHQLKLQGCGDTAAPLPSAAAQHVWRPCATDPGSVCRQSACSAFEGGWRRPMSLEKVSERKGSLARWCHLVVLRRLASSLLFLVASSVRRVTPKISSWIRFSSRSLSMSASAFSSVIFP